MRGRPRRSVTYLALELSIVVLALAGAGSLDPSGLHTLSPPLSPFATFSGVTGYVYADTNEYAPTVGLDAATVTIYDQCTSLESMTCTLVSSTTTNSTGFFGVNLVSGSGYYVVVSRNSTPAPFAPEGFGGAVQGFTAPTTTPLGIDVYPYVPYGNASFVLPKYNCMESYLNNLDGGGPGCQNPVLSWTQDGAYYVNTDDELVFYSFINDTAYDLARWTPLYQTFATYPMIANELFITQDGSYVYGWGEEIVSSGNLTVEAVNVTTHRVFLYNFTEVTAAEAAGSGQVDLTGWDGNDSQAVLIVDGDVFDHDLWSSSESFVYTLPFFEANNLYWMPYLNGFIDVEADGSSGDYVAEFQLTGPVASSSGYALAETYSAPWTSAAIVVNGVNGVSFNVTSRQLSVQAENSGLVYSVLPNGTISSLIEVINLDRDASCVCVTLGTTSAADRPILVASGPELSKNYNGFINDTWLTDMSPGHYGLYSSNQSPYVYNPDASLGTVYTLQSWYQEGQFLNTSYIISQESYACDTDFPGTCTINGTHGATKGTIWWLWKLGLPEFPFPATAPAADDLDPASTVVTSVTLAGTGATLDWTPIEADTIINYTVAWGTTPGELTNTASVPGSESSYTIPGLSPNTRYYDSVEAWNLHFHGGSSGILTFFSAPEVTQLAVTGSNETNISLAWTNPPGGAFTNLSLQYGTSPSSLNVHESVGQVSSMTVPGLASGSTYYFEVQAWNGTSAGLASTVVSASTTFSGVTDLAVTGVGVTNVSLSWTNPASGRFTNLTLEYGIAEGALTTIRSVGTVASYSVTGLRSSTTYYFELVAWNNSVRGLPSNVASALTSFTGPTYLTVTGTTNQSVSLAWQNPASGTFTNITLEFGTSESVLSQHLSLGTDSSYIVSGLTAVTTYYFELEAWNGTAMGTPSNEVSTTTSATPPPVVVVGASALTVTSSTDQSISLAWTNPASATFTNLTLEFGTSVSALSDHLSVGTVSSYIVTGLAPSTTYYFRVIAWNGTTETPPSNEVSGSTAAPPPSTTTSSGVSWTDFYLVSALLVALAIVLAVLLLRRRRKPESPVVSWTEGLPASSGALPPGPPTPPGGS